MSQSRKIIRPVFLESISNLEKLIDPHIKYYSTDSGFDVTAK